MHEYAFDVKMLAVVRLKAIDQARAESALVEALDCARLNVKLTKQESEMHITEASIYVDDEQFPFLFEVDGEEVA